MIKTQIDRETDKRMVLGTVLEGKNWVFVILGSQGGPLERLWEGFWKEKLETKKKSKNTRWRRWPRRDMRGLVGKGREGFGTGLIRHALAHPSDGRADCLRFASPAEATWRLEALKALSL